MGKENTVNGGAGMRIDLTLPITKEMLAEQKGPALMGHMGTHFDGMNLPFPLEYTERRGVVFDLRGMANREIDVTDVDLNAVERDMFVAFCTEFVERVGYGKEGYYAQHPQLSVALIDALLDKGVSLIGVDFAGVRRGAEHTPTDRRCAEQGVFIVENLCNLGQVVQSGGQFLACTYPLNCTETSGVPCRVIAKTDDGN